MVATAWTAWWRPSPFWRQSRRIFQFFIRVKVCSARARTRRCSALSSSWPRRRGAAGSLAVRDDQAGAEVGAVRDHRRPGRGGRQARLPPDVGVGLVARCGPGRGDDQAGVRIDDDLHVRREPVVAGRGAHLAVADRDQGSVHDPQPVHVSNRPRGRLQGQQRPQAVDDPADGGSGDPEERGELPHGEVGAVVDGHQQDPVCQRQAPRPATTGTVPAPLLHHFHELREPVDPQACERLDPHRLSPQHPTHTGECPELSLLQHPLRARAWLVVVRRDLDR
ncbi:hypothetical protein SAMN05216483_0035 [Streptomyces sp. 2131.1]|nr:hypothetical protein SAMN05216483_0035 [Streptomyces sp. 2131.1]